MAWAALRPPSRHSRTGKHRRLLPDGEREPVQDSVPRHDGPLSWQDHLPHLSRYPAEEGGRLREDWGPQHYRPGTDARSKAEGVVRPFRTDGTGAGNRQTTADGNKIPPAVPLRRRTGLPDAEPHVEHPEWRRKPAHQPGHIIRLLARGFLIYIRRAKHWLALTRHPTAHQGAERAAGTGQYRYRRRARRRNYACCRLRHRRRPRCRPAGGRDCV